MPVPKESVRKFYTAIASQCCAEKYNLYLHKHLGDIFYAAAMHDAFEKAWGKKLHYIVNPRYEFIMQMFGINDYSLYNPKWFETEAISSHFPYIPRAAHASHQYDMMCKDIFPSLPLLGQPFIADGDMTSFFIWDRYWCYLWAYNCGLDVDKFKFPLPKNKIHLSLKARKSLKKIGPLEKIVLIAPEGATAIEIGVEYWNIIAEAAHKKGYHIVVNSNRYDIKHGISAFDLKLSLQDVVALGMNCAYVFSLRTGLCDVLVGVGSRLYSIYPAMLRREAGSLIKPFATSTGVNEIIFHDWKTTDFYWEGLDLTKPIQQEINRWHRNFKLTKLKSKLFVQNKGRHHFWCRVFSDVAGQGIHFPENNRENPLFLDKRVSFLGIPLYQKKYKYQHSSIQISYLGGLVHTVRNGKNKRVHTLGLQVYARTGLQRKLLFLSWIPRKGWLAALNAQIDPKYDDIYLFRYDFGESYVELLHLAERIRVHGSKKPLVIVRDERYLNFFRMYLPKGVNYQLIPMDHKSLSDAFESKSLSDTEVVLPYKGRRFICSTPRLIEKLERAQSRDPQVNFYSYLLHSMGIVETAKTSEPTITAELKERASQVAQELELGDRYIIISPETTSVKELKSSFWIQLISELSSRGYKIFVNSLSGNWGSACTHAFLDAAELFVLAQGAKGIISMSNGLASFLSGAGAPMDIIYTDFMGKRCFYTSTFVKQVYSVQHLPGVTLQQVNEYDTAEISLKNIARTILNRYIK